MHGISIPLTLLAPPPSTTTTTIFFSFSSSESLSNHQSLLLLPRPYRSKPSIPICRYGRHGSDSKKLLRRFPSHAYLWNSNKEMRRNYKYSSVLRASSRGGGESPYQVLGVSPSATPTEIKRAYRRLALKFHPDVNKEANAQEKFMRIKHAYNTLLNSPTRRKYDYGSAGSGNSSSKAERNRSRSAQEEEEFYGFGDFFRDLQTEFQNWETSAGSQGKPKSLWEELADIGEEFVEFLEKELNITDDADPGTAGSPDESSGSQRKENDVRTDANKESSIEDNIDEIEATLAQLKKELGL